MDMLEIVGESMGLQHEDHYKRLKIMQDADDIERFAAISPRSISSIPRPCGLRIQSMLEEQPLPLRGQQAR